MLTAPDTTHTATNVLPRLGGVTVIYQFPNGYGASVIRNPYSYGGPSDLWELAVLAPDGSLTYDTPVTSDVLGHLTDEDVQAALDAIAALPQAVSA